MWECHLPDLLMLSVDKSAKVTIKKMVYAVAKGMKFEGEVVFEATGKWIVQEDSVQQEGAGTATSHTH